MSWNVFELSYGKDSVAMVIRALEEGLPVDEIVFVQVMATENLRADLPCVIGYEEKVNKYLFEKFGKVVKVITSERTFENYFYKVRERGVYEGDIYGWPLTLGSWCQGRLKADVLNRYERQCIRQYGNGVRFYIGLAADEPERVNRPGVKGKFMPLVEWGMSEADCVEFLRARNLLSDFHERSRRTGCFFCPKQRVDSLRMIKYEYPELWAIMLEWDKASAVSFKPRQTLAQINYRI